LPYSISSGYNYFGLKPFFIDTISSDLVDEEQMDIYVACIEGIEGSILQSDMITSYVLINAYTLNWSPRTTEDPSVSLHNFYVKDDASYSIDG
jgi:hypothetical protein